MIRRGEWWPWLVLAAFVAIPAVGYLLWLLAALAALLGPGHVIGFGAPFLADLLTGRTGQAWPGVSPVLLVVLTLLAVAAGAVTGWWAARWVGRLLDARRRSAAWRAALPSLAGPADLEGLMGASALARARQLRPSLARVERPAAGDVGWQVGTLIPAGGAIRGSHEDVGLAVMAPRAGKTTSLAVPIVLQAPGAVVATSNKADLWAATAAIRAADRPRRVWVFDPQQIAYTERTWWWNPLAGVRSVEDADRLASHFMQEIRGGSGGDFWVKAGGDLLASLLLAAAVDGRGVREVYRWLNDSASSRPADLLDEHGFPAVAQGLRGRQLGAIETKEGIYETARSAASCLRNGQIMAWVDGGDPADAFDVEAFAASADTLYLLSKRDEGAAAPLVAALTDQILRAAIRRAEAAGGRLDPPMTVCLDEAANVCKIKDLPDLYSHLGSRGITPLTILQSYRQGVGVWGETGMDTLWSAATIKIVGAGLDDPRFTEDLSRLVGEHDVDTETLSGSAQGRSWSVSPRRQRILEAGTIRAMPKGRGLLFATGARAAAVALRPWYREPAPIRDRIGQATKAATRELADRAAAASPPAAASPAPTSLATTSSGRQP